MTNQNSAHTVLIVEDDEELRELMCDALQMRGYSVVTAREGNDALQKLDRIGAPRLILLDLLMPGMNGWDFFKKVREQPHLASVPVIIHSSSYDPPAGATRVLQKPLVFETLLAVVAEFCAN